MNVHAFHQPGHRNPMSTWDNDARQLIAERLKAGDSASQIASYFEGKSRNAVIGVVMRDPVLSKIGFANSRGSHGKVAKQSLLGRKRKLTKPSARPSEPQTVGRPMSALRANQCQFTVNDAGIGQTHLFCGLPSDGAWCPYHRGVVYQPRSSLNDKRARA